MFLTNLYCAGVVRCEADYSYNADAHGWVKIHTTPEPWEDAFLRCHSEGKRKLEVSVACSDMDIVLDTRLVRWLSGRLLRYMSRVRSPHGTNICMAFRWLFRVWLFVYVISLSL